MPQTLIFEDNCKNIQIHDKEVACYSLLSHNVFEIPFVESDENENIIIENTSTNFKKLHFGKKVQYLSRFMYLSGVTSTIPL